MAQTIRPVYHVFIVLGTIAMVLIGLVLFLIVRGRFRTRKERRRAKKARMEAISQGLPDPGHDQALEQTLPPVIQKPPSRMSRLFGLQTPTKGIGWKRSYPSALQSDSSSEKKKKSLKARFRLKKKRRNEDGDSTAFAQLDEVDSQEEFVVLHQKGEKGVRR